AARSRGVASRTEAGAVRVVPCEVALVFMVIELVERPTDRLSWISESPLRTGIRLTVRSSDFPGASARAKKIAGPLIWALGPAPMIRQLELRPWSRRVIPSSWRGSVFWTVSSMLIGPPTTLSSLDQDPFTLTL